jgi:hypothetical protein
MDQEIDLAKLKETYRADPLTYHIWSVAADCKVRSRAFWQHFVRMKRRHNWISVPLLVLSSGTGVSSVAQIGGGNGAGAALSVLVTVLGVSVAILTALQRFLRYSERAEESKYMAKNYSKIARAIQYNMTLVESQAIVFKPTAFLAFVERFHKDMDGLLGEATDLPHELLSRRASLRGWLGLRGARDGGEAPRVCVEKAQPRPEPESAQHFDDWVRTPPGMSAMAPEREPARTPARIVDSNEVSPSVDARYRPVTLDLIKEELSRRAARGRDRSRSRSRSPRLRRSASDSY